MKNRWLCLLAACMVFVSCLAPDSAKFDPPARADSTSASQVSLASVDSLHVAELCFPFIEHPAIGVSDTVIHHKGFSLLYSEEHEQANWVAYELNRDEAEGRIRRTDNFRPDPAVSTGSATAADYVGSGFDRGHLAPAADMAWSPESMRESFYFSNMSPQDRGFNRGIWRRLEALVRSWAISDGSMHIVTGPVLRPGLPAIGPDSVSVPEYYYKVILDCSEPDVRGIAFIMPNMASREALHTFAVSIDSAEAFTGIDFFPGLPDDLEAAIEEALCTSCWAW